MASIFEIPLSGHAQRFVCTLSGVQYQLVFVWRDVINGGWFLDINTPAGVGIVHGLPLVTGADLLAPFAHLGFVGSLVVIGDGSADAPPSYDNLGTTSHLYYVTS